MINESCQSDIHKSNSLFEIKYKIPTSLLNTLSTTVRHHTLIPASFSTAKLKTWYFDDEANTSFWESINGELSKTKYRFREYIAPEQGGALYSLEIKRRNNAETSKLKELIYKPISKDYKFTTFRDLLAEIERHSDLDLKPFYHYLPDKTLFPSTLIQYKRSRFDSLEGNVRYNIDTNIMVTLTPQQFLATDQTHHLEHSIFEIKSSMPEFFPSFLQRLNLSPTSFSKFAWGKEMLDKLVI